MNISQNVADHVISRWSIVTAVLVVCDLLSVDHWLFRWEHWNTIKIDGIFICSFWNECVPLLVLFNRQSVWVLNVKVFELLIFLFITKAGLPHSGILSFS
jgi:hypothetical protein